VGLIALGAASRATLARPFYWASGLILALALFSAFSSLWSGSVELSVNEADRVLVYLGVFVAAFLIAQTDARRERFGEGVAIALIGIAILMLGSRLLPHVLEVDAGLGSGSRIRYPLGYWNANGMATALGVVLALWMSRRSPSAALRWIAIGAIPALLTALYLTYSRGAVLGLVIGAFVLIALSHDRFWILLKLGIGLLGALPAILAIQARTNIAENRPFPGVIDEGVAVVLYLVAGIVLALALTWALVQLERRGGSRTGRILEVSRDARFLRWVGIALAVVAIVAAVAVGGRAWNQFTTGEAGGTEQQNASRLQSLSGAGRDEFFRVALDAFAEKPVGGTGAGTYQFSWFQLRHNDVANHDAHSLYLQALSELGVPGAILVLAMIGVLLWAGFCAWRDGSGPHREALAAFLAVALAFAVGAAIDWFWQIAALTVVFFCVTGALVAARCGQLVRKRAEANGGGSAPRRYGLTVVGLAVAWLTAVALVGPLLVDRELDASRASASDENIPQAIDRAETARSIEPFAASPYIQLGLLAQAQGDYPGAVERLEEAIDREDRNWIYHYLLAKAEHAGAEANTPGFSFARAEDDLHRAQELNPEEKCLREGWEGCG
jgi:O-antigen ligase